MSLVQRLQLDSAWLAAIASLRSGLRDAALLDEALGALLAKCRAAEFDIMYEGYDDHALDTTDEWGDLASFRAAAGSS